MRKSYRWGGSHERPCGRIHPLPCGLDLDCPVPPEYFEDDLTDEHVYENYQDD